ncbi:TRAP transporter small permease [Mesorhizobium sp. CAU 1741]|uniref:TRAP transporter small permease n=1 Tax=Mesorhizobium sp. CAU 1741 TaxID=3140366 RepID=UPI00325B666C
MRSTLERGLSFFDRLCMALAQLAIFVMMLSISADALGRYLFNRPLQGSFEFTTLYLMVILTFLGLPATYASGGHIRLDVLRPWIARIPGNPVERLNSLIAACVFGFLAWHSGLEAIAKFADGDTSFGVIQFPLYWSYVWVPVGCGLLTLRLAVEIVFPRVDHEDIH